MSNIPLYTMFNIPETFGKALSYEGQLHAICQRFDDVLTSLNDVIIEVYETVENVYDTVSDMVNDINLSVGMHVRTEGFYNINDNGGAFYRIYENVTPNGFDKIELDNGLTACFIAVFPFVMPEQFGAIGDGIINDSVPIKIACDYSDNIIFKSSKIYDITNTDMVLKNGKTFLLNGSTIKVDIKTVIKNYELTDTFTEYNGNGNITFENGTIIGIAFAFMHGNGIVFRNIDFKDCIGIHYIQLGGCENIYISDCTFTGMLDDVGTREGINIEASEYDAQPYCDNQSPMYDNTPSRNIYVMNSTFSPNLNNQTYNFIGDGIGTHFVTKDANNDAVSGFFTNINVINCKFKNARPDYYAIRCNNWKDSVIENCIFDTVAGIQCGLQYYKNNHVDIHGNFFTGSTSLLALKSGDCIDMVYYGNTCKNMSLNQFIYFNAIDNLDQGLVSFAKCDGFRLMSPFPDYFNLSNYNHIDVFVGYQSAGNYNKASFYGYRNNAVLDGQTVMVRTQRGGDLLVTINDTGITCALDVRSVVAYVD